MFETIEELFTIGFWAVAILLFVGGIAVCICGFTSGSAWKIITSVFALLLGIYAFVRMYEKYESIAWCLMTSGLAFSLPAIFSPNGNESRTSTQSKKSFSEAYLEAYAEEKLIEEAVTNALRKNRD